MSNEDKILELLTQMSGDISSLRQQMGQMDQRISDRLDRVEDRAQRTAVLLETEVDRKLDLLYEGHDAIMERLDKLASRSRVEELENDVVLLKDAIKLMRLEIDKLKKAQ